jgi:hypothetical protein
MKRAISVVVAAICAGMVSGNVPDYEKNALLEIYGATDGPNWIKPWINIDTTDPCVAQWLGISCDGANTTVEYVGAHELRTAVPR